MTPSSSANNIVRPLSPTPQRARPPPTLYMCASCPEFGACNHFSSDSGVGDDSDLVFQNSRYSSASDTDVVGAVEVDGITMVEVAFPDDESVYGTARVPQGEFTASPRGVVIHSTCAGPPPSPSPSPSRARALAKMAGKAKGIAKMFSLRKLSRKPSVEVPIPLPMVSSTSAVAVSGSWPDGAGGWSQTSPQRPPISILVTSESMTDAITYRISPNARLMSSSSTTGIYTPDDDEPRRDFDDPQSPTPSPVVPQGAGALRRLEVVLVDGAGDVFDMPRGRPTTRGTLANRSTRAAAQSPAPKADAARPSALTAGPQQAAALASPTPGSCSFPNLLRILLFMPWCIAVGATITLFPAHIDAVVFSESAGYIPSPAPRGVERFCFWVDTARDYACIFVAALLSLFLVSASVGSVACALALARFVWVWGTYACARGTAPGCCCCVHNPERLGEDDMESLALIARGGDTANLVLRQCAEHAGAKPSRK